LTDPDNPIQKRIKETNYLVTEDGYLAPTFFMRFFSYVAAIPLPKSAYAEFDILRTLQVPEKDKEKGPDLANAALVAATMASRITSWKRFFCSKLVGSPVCADEASILSIVKYTLPQISSTDLTVAQPPALPRSDVGGDPFPGPFSCYRSLSGC
jgi:hypothetical protein